MGVDTILQSEFAVKFIYPFLLIFFIVFAVLEKTKTFGEGKTTINAFIAAVIGFIFIAAVGPKMIVSNMILFFAVALVILFVILMLWGFVSADNKEGFKIEGWMKWLLWIAVLVGVIAAVFWATGVGGNVIDTLFRQSWSGSFWSNALFVILIAAAIAVAIKSGKGGK